MGKDASQAADRVKELESALASKVSANREVADAFQIDEKGTVVISTEQKSVFDANMKDIREIQGLINDFKAYGQAESYTSEPDHESVAAGAAAAAGRSLPENYGKTLGQMFTDSAEFKELQNGHNGATMRSPFELKRANLGDMYRGDHVKDLYAGTPPTLGDYTAQAVQYDPMVQRMRRKTRVRDLFPVQRTTAATIEFFQVVGFTNNASTVAQRNGANNAFQTKPQSTLSFGSQAATVRTIAHWEAAHRNVLADEPQLQGIIDNELLYGLRLVEDAQILAGTGQGEDLLGILNTPGIQSYNWSDGATLPVADTKADAIRRAATLSFLAYYEPSGVVVHPNDWEDIELTKNTHGDYLLAVSIAMGGEQRVWRMPVIDTPAIQEGTALLGSFGIGAQLYDREEANIRVAEQHADFFIRNAVVVLAEERLALATKRPESFVEIKFNHAPS